MWTCPACGEQIENQFDTCWKCAGETADVPEVSGAKEPPPIECLRCKTRLEFLGKKYFRQSGQLASYLAGELVAGSETFDLYACPQCGHVEFFLERVGEELRQKNDLEDSRTSDEQSPVPEQAHE